LELVLLILKGIEVTPSETFIHKIPYQGYYCLGNTS